MFKLLHSKTNQYLYKMHLCNQSSHYKKYEWSHVPQLQVPCSSITLWKVKYLLRFFVNLLHSNMSQDLVEKHLCNQGSHYEKIQMISITHAKEAITCNHQIDTFRCQQRWMEHKGGHWLVHEEFIVHTAVYQKAYLELKQCRTVKKSSS